jgi:hypothetical protein
MGIRRILIPAIVALGAAGSILAGSAVPAAVAQAPAVHAQAAAPHMIPLTYYHE